MTPKETINELKKILEEYNKSSRFPYKKGVPATEKEVEEMEEQLDLEFPEEYKEFLREFGYLDVPACEGIRGKSDNKYKSTKDTTLKLRKEWPDNTFPKNVISIESDGFGNEYCLVCKGDDYGKVIFWQHDAEDNYPSYPDNKPDFWIEGDNFLDWLIKRLEELIEYEDEKRQERIYN